MLNTQKKGWALFLVFLTLAFQSIFTGCGRMTEDEKTRIRGKQLSEIYCKSCHLYTGPELLDRSSWVKVLGVMKKEMVKISLQLADSDWLDIQRYYLESSPAILGQPASKKKIEANHIFHKTNFVLDSVPGIIPASTLVEYDQNRNILYTGDISGNLYEFNRAEFTKVLNINNIPIDVDFNPGDGTLEVLGIGSLKPSEEMTGQLIKIYPNGDQRIIIDSLKRPVHFIRKDFDNDGNEEYLISVFGSTVGQINSGKLSAFTLVNGAFKEIIIKQLPGAIRSAAGDFNDDNKLDIIALFTQGNEVITLFLNKGNLEFEEKQLLEFLPVYGTNYFELADMNDDSFPDIIVTNGDNGDSSPIFKSFHGLRIFINNGKNDFDEAYFYPIHGASKVLVRDFDGDKDLDFLVIAMYPDLFSWPQETLVFFENHGNLDFEVTSIEKEPTGKWLLMDAGDFDDDGDEDLIVGANLVIHAVLMPPKYKQIWNRDKVAYAIFTNDN